MRPGDLRRFTVGAPGATFTGEVFVVLARYDHLLDAYLSADRVDFLVADGIRRGWSSSWVEDNSEVLDVVE